MTDLSKMSNEDLLFEIWLSSHRCEHWIPFKCEDRIYQELMRRLSYYLHDLEQDAIETIVIKPRGNNAKPE